MDIYTWIMTIFPFVFLLFVYLIPMQVAHFRNHNDRNAISALNVLLGFTVIGWIAALIWSLTSNTTRKTSMT